MTDGSPENILDDADPGDETFRRYRYQATYAAILAVGSLHRNASIAELFAEHHDDILLKMRSGCFNAVQVKTQQPGDSPFKSNDEAIKTALGKFIAHERKFGDFFEAYTITTNHQFFRKDNKSSLYFLIEKAKEATGAAPEQMDKRLSGYLNSLLKEYNNGLDRADRASRDDLLTMLRKLRVDDSPPKLEDIHQKLREAIVTSDPEYRAATYADLERAANALAYVAYLKSSKSTNDAAHLYLTFMEDPKSATIDDTIQNKRMSKADVQTILAREINASASLAAAEPIDPRSIPTDLSKSDRKMTGGGLSATTVAASRDWQASAEHLQPQWAMKFGEKPALERYHHVAVVVQTACSEAYEATRANTPQGPPMLESLKNVLREKRREGVNTFDCEEEHLLGHAIIRTGQCKVWWSQEFEIE